MLAVANWLLGLSVPWLALVVFAATGLITAGIYAIVMALAANERRGLAFKAVSPGMLPPLGLVFGLVVGFIAAQVWSDAGTAQQAVDREASALRAANLVADQFPEARAARIHALVQSHIRTAVAEEWPAMAEQHETLTGVPPALGAALHVALSLNPANDGQAVAQRDLVSSLENALDARRQRIIVSQSSVNWVKWTGVILLAALTLLAIAFVHSENRVTAALAMGVFAAAVAVVVVMIAAQDGPFRGQLGVKPTPLEEVAPSAG
jgi:Protein of unknown function (DUF4239)